MKLLVCFALLLAASAASAEPPGMSQNPRVGLLAEIEFAPGSARLPEASGSQIGRIAAWALENWNGLVVLDGHADPTGPARGDVRLSLRRARIVRDQLVALGVDPSQIVVTAFDAENQRRRPRVAVWGTRNSLDEVIAVGRASRRFAIIPPYEDRPERALTIVGGR